MLKVTRKGMTMLTNEERIRALIGNLKNWDWSIFPQYRLEKEDAAALMKLLNNAKEKNNE
ncbi:MAG: hypothetical protein IKS93_01325 [Methanobrevibacter sp.]|nr:hypothetical protein [Methanobrevibacter sp.]